MSDKFVKLIFRTEFSSSGHDQVHVHVGVVVAVVVDGVVVLDVDKTVDFQVGFKWSQKRFILLKLAIIVWCLKMKTCH